MRKALALPLLLLVLGVAACGGGGSSGSGGTSTSTVTAAATGPEAKWGKEVEAVMRRFENQVTARLTPKIHTTAAQPLAEPLYRSYGAALTNLGDMLGATMAPEPCIAMRDRMADDAHALGQLTTRLGHESKVDQEEFSSLVVIQESKMRRYGRDLTEITYQPHC